LLAVGVLILTMEVLEVSSQLIGVLVGLSFPASGASDLLAFQVPISFHVLEMAKKRLKPHRPTAKNQNGSQPPRNLLIGALGKPKRKKAKKGGRL